MAPSNRHTRRVARGVLSSARQEFTRATRTRDAYVVALILSESFSVTR